LICDRMENPYEAAKCKSLLRAKRIRHLAVLFGILGVVLLLFVALPYRFGMIVGDSMYPTMQPDHLFVMNINPYTRSNPARSEIVVFKHGGVTMIKRVYGIGADMVWLLISRGGTEVIPADKVNAYREKIGNQRMPVIIKPLIIPVGSVFVLGDNSANSEDSRDYGPVPVSEILGKVVYTEDWKTLNMLRDSRT